MLDTVIGLGSNLGDSRAQLRQALGLIAKLGELAGVSALYETEPVGPAQPMFRNAACRLRTELSAPELLEALLAIERSLGRVRAERWGPRLIDLDILWIRGTSVDSADLRVPHPELRRRAFALCPLLEVAPEATDPRDGSCYEEVLRALGTEGVRVISQKPGDWV